MDADLARIGTLLADPKRAKILLALLGGTPQPASALADAAGASRSLASAHLRKLVEGGLVTVQPRGRQRLYEISGQPVADAIEGRMQLSPPTQVRSLRDANRKENLRQARFCYDHLAGVLGVSLTEALLDRGALEVVAEARLAQVLLAVGVAKRAHLRRRRELHQPLDC